MRRVSVLKALIFTSIVAAICACTTLGDGGVTVNFGDVVQRQQNLLFTFDDDMVPDSLLNRWDTTRLVKFAPEVPGKVKWIARNQMVFSPGVGFAAATSYSATLSPDIAKYAPGASMPSRTTFSFHTPVLQLDRTAALWVKNPSTGAVEIRLTLGFNYSVNPMHVGERLHVLRNGAELPFALASTTVGEQVVASVPATALGNDDAVALKIRIDAGLPCEESQALTEGALEASLQLPSRTRLEVVDVHTSWEGMEGIVEITTTQAIDPATLPGNVTVNSGNFQATVTASATGITLRGPFLVDDSYYVSLSENIRGVVGGVFEQGTSVNVSFSAMESGIAFASGKAMYLSARGSRAIGVRIANVPRVRISVFRVYENNILHLMNRGRYTSYDDDGMESGETRYNFDYIGLSDYADTVMTREVETKDLGAVSNGVASFTFDVREHTQRKGLYLLKIESTDEQWLQATKLVSLSDIGLIAKEGTENLTVFANTIAEARPMSGVELTLISTNNQVIGQISTNGEGVAHMDDLRAAYGPFKLGMISARNGDDYTVLVMNDTRVDQSRFDAGGVRDNASGMQAFIYGDRNLYRPSESIHLNTIVRDRTWKPIAGAPVKLRVIQPNGRELRTLQIRPDEQGAATADIPLSASAITGMYRVEALSATDVLIGSYTVAVEEFMPDRVKVQVTTSRDVLYPGEPVDLSIGGMSFYGTPAAKRTFEVTMRLLRKPFTAKKYPDYDFSLRGNSQEEAAGSQAQQGTERRIGADVVRTGTLDDQGNASVSFVVDSALKNSGLMAADFYVTVFDESGRPVHRYVSRPVHTQPALFGVKRIDRYVASGQQVGVPVVATTNDGALTSAQARVRVVRKEWHTVMERGYGSGIRYVSQMRELVLSDNVVAISGDNTRIPFTPQESGEYEIRVGAPAGNTYVAYSFWAWRWGSTASTSFEVNTEGLVDIELDKDSYAPGETATALFKTPFVGKLIVTVERDGVMEHHVVETDKRSATVALKVGDAWAPNVYIAATLIKPHAGGEMPLTVAHGYAPLMVKRPSSVLPVSIVATRSSRSHTKQNITVKTEPGAYVTVAVVDEGILQIRDTKTPDPHGFFYAKRALQVNSFDMYPFLFPELQVMRMAYGAGDDAYGRRLNPVMNKRVNLVSFWSGILSAKGGTATISVDIPEFSGSLRVMAVAWKNASFGSSEQVITVADPLVLSTALPRVLSPGDSVQVPVLVTNTTGKMAAVSCMLQTQGPVSVVGGNSRALSVEPGREVVAQFTIVAGTALGEAVVTTEAKGLGETFRQTTSIAVRPSVPLQEESGVASVKAGETQTVAMQSRGFMPGTTRGRLLVSAFPAVQISRNLGQLLGYPHGCVEQTISRAFPQIYFADLAHAWKADVAMTSDPAKNVQEAVRKVQSMQSYNGGVSYWPGGTNVTWWGSSYAAHFLQEAKRAGYDVDDRVLLNLHQYLAKRVRARETEGMRVPAGDGYVVKSVPSRDIFYSLFVLASAGRQDVPTMNMYKNEMGQLSADSRYMLACTYLLLGDRRSYDAIVPRTFEETRYRPFDDGSFASPIRDMAIALYAMVSATPDDPQTGKLAQRLSELMRKDDIYSTQENAWAVLALGKLARRSMKVGATATITSNGKVVGEMKGTTVAISDADGGNYNVSARGGNVYVFWSMEGIRADGGFAQNDAVLKVRRTYLTRNGSPLNMASVHQNDLIVIKVSVVTTDRSVVNNVAVSDLLPSGFELENPRLGALEGMEWAKDGAVAQFYDYRDDRMNFFTEVTPTVKNFYYTVRAVSRGRFRMPPIGADAMYNDDIHSYHGAGTVTVL